MCVSADGSPGVCGEEDEGQKVPSFQEAFTEALLTADLSTQQGQLSLPKFILTLTSCTYTHTHSHTHTHTGQSSKKTAKKGRKKLVLFSTGGSRGSLN